MTSKISHADLVLNAMRGEGYAEPLYARLRENAAFDNAMSELRRANPNKTRGELLSGYSVYFLKTHCEAYSRAILWRGFNC